KLEAQINRALLGVARLRQVLETAQRLLISGARLLVGRTRHRASPGLLGVIDRRIPLLTLERMVSESLHVLGEPLHVEPLDGAQNAAVKRPPALTKKGAIGD